MLSHVQALKGLQSDTNGKASPCQFEVLYFCVSMGFMIMIFSFYLISAVNFSSFTILFFLLEIKRVMTHFPLHMWHPSSTSQNHLIKEKQKRSLASYDSRRQHKLSKKTKAQVKQLMHCWNCLLLQLKINNLMSKTSEKRDHRHLNIVEVKSVVSIYQSIAARL